MAFTSTYIEKLVGKDFEVKCHTIVVNDSNDHSPPVFSGPGVIKGSAYGEMSFQLHNQLQIPKYISEFIDDLRNRDEQYRFRAWDYQDEEWSGAWFLPSVTFHNAADKNRFMVSGEFSQLSIILKKFSTDTQKNQTQILFSENPNLPTGRRRLEKRESGSSETTIVESEDWEELSFGGSTFTLCEDANSGLFHIVATHSETFKPTYLENWIPEALSFVMGNLIYPRMVIRHFDDRSLVFVRDLPPPKESGIEACVPKWMHTKNVFWEIFQTYMLYLARREEFEQLPTSQIFGEVIYASRATLQSFILSLAVCAENLIQQLMPNLDLNKPDKAQIKLITTQVGKAKVNSDLRDRAIGLLSMLNRPSLNEAGKLLIRQGVLCDEHIQAWKRTRNHLAHGGLIEFPISDDLWQDRHFLVGMVYRLIYQIIGYKGKIADYGFERNELTEFPNTVNE